MKKRLKQEHHIPSGNLLEDIRRLIETSRQNVAMAVNRSLTHLYWQIGTLSLDYQVFKT